MFDRLNNSIVGVAVNHLVRAARQDPGKASVLALLVVVMLILWGKVLTGGNHGAGPAEARAVARSTMAGDGLSAAVARQEMGMESGGVFQEWLSLPVRPVERNLFAVRLDYFPTDGSRAIRGGQGIGEGFWDQLEKSTAAQADQRRERQILVENLRRQAAQLRLQTIVMGETPKAMINGQPVGEGDVVGSFRVARIEARRVVIEREGVLLELHMK